MVFENVTLSEVKYFNFKPAIPYRQVKQNDKDVRLKFVTSNFIAHEKKSVNENAQYPYLIKIALDDMSELEALKMSIELVAGEIVDVACGNVVYVNATKEVYDAVKYLAAGVPMIFEARVRHLVYFTSPPRVKFVLEGFYSTPVVQPQSKPKRKPKLQRQNAIDPKADEDAAEAFLATLQLQG